MRETTIHLKLELAGSTAWKEIEKLLTDLGYTCNECGYRLLKHHTSTSTLYNNEEELLSVEEMTL